MANQDRPFAVVEDFLVHNCGKKIRELMAKEREKFVSAVDATGYGRDLGNEWFDIIEPFADYAFPKAHAYGYGLIAYQTAWLKANHPVEYLARPPDVGQGQPGPLGRLPERVPSKKITVDVPDVNRSASDFSVSDGVILFGLSAVRNVARGWWRSSSPSARPTAVLDFHDFCTACRPRSSTSAAIESLVKAGGFDSLGHPRKSLLVVHELVIERACASGSCATRPR